MEKPLPQCPEKGNGQPPASTVTDRLAGKKHSREIRSKDFLSSAFGFTWQVSRFSFAGCLLDWNREHGEVTCSTFPSPAGSVPRGGVGGGRWLQAANLIKSYSAIRILNVIKEGKIILVV